MRQIIFVVFIISLGFRLSGQSYRIGSWNIEHLTQEKWNTWKTTINQILKDNAIDICFIQELNDDLNLAESEDYTFKMMSPQYCSKCGNSSNPSWTSRRGGNSELYGYLIKTDFINLSKINVVSHKDTENKIKNFYQGNREDDTDFEDDIFYRPPGIATINFTKGKKKLSLLVFNYHAAFDGARINSEYQQLNNLIVKQQDDGKKDFDNVLLLGDFNAGELELPDQAPTGPQSGLQITQKLIQFRKYIVDGVPQKGFDKLKDHHQLFNYEYLRSLNYTNGAESFPCTTISSPHDIIVSKNLSNLCGEMNVVRKNNRKFFIKPAGFSVWDTDNKATKPKSVVIDKLNKLIEKTASNKDEIGTEKHCVCSDRTITYIEMKENIRKNNFLSDHALIYFDFNPFPNINNQQVTNATQPQLQNILNATTSDKEPVFNYVFNYKRQSYQDKKWEYLSTKGPLFTLRGEGFAKREISEIPIYYSSKRLDNKDEYRINGKYQEWDLVKKDIYAKIDKKGNMVSYSMSSNVKPDAMDEEKEVEFKIIPKDLEKYWEKVREEMIKGGENRKSFKLFTYLDLDWNGKYEEGIDMVDTISINCIIKKNHLAVALPEEYTLQDKIKKKKTVYNTTKINNYVPENKQKIAYHFLVESLGKRGSTEQKAETEPSERKKLKVSASRKRNNLSQSSNNDELFTLEIKDKSKLNSNMVELFEVEKLFDKIKGEKITDIELKITSTYEDSNYNDTIVFDISGAYKVKPSNAAVVNKQREKSETKKFYDAYGKNCDQKGDDIKYIYPKIPEYFDGDTLTLSYKSSKDKNYTPLDVKVVKSGDDFVSNHTFNVKEMLGKDKIKSLEFKGEFLSCKCYKQINVDLLKCETSDEESYLNPFNLPDYNSETELLIKILVGTLTGMAIEEFLFMFTSTAFSTLAEIGLVTLFNTPEMLLSGELGIEMKTLASEVGGAASEAAESKAEQLVAKMAKDPMFQNTAISREGSAVKVIVNTKKYIGKIAEIYNWYEKHNRNEVVFAYRDRKSNTMKLHVSEMASVEKIRELKSLLLWQKPIDINQLESSKFENIKLDLRNAECVLNEKDNIISCVRIAREKIKLDRYQFQDGEFLSIGNEFIEYPQNCTKCKLVAPQNIQLTSNLLFVGEDNSFTATIGSLREKKYTQHKEPIIKNLKEIVKEYSIKYPRNPKLEVLPVEEWSMTSIGDNTIYISNCINNYYSGMPNNLSSKIVMLNKSYIEGKSNQINWIDKTHRTYEKPLFSLGDYLVNYFQN
ncbi:MAG: hypothetical protein KDC16_10705, partial [Saprospiraceae bacterium]|nr:hypothetical protein [Saprospiraceae bacterium]